MGLTIEQLQRMYPERFNLNLQAKRSKAGDVNFSMPSLNYPYLIELAKRIYSSGYQPGTGMFEYRDPGFTFNLPHMNIGNMLNTGAVRSPQTQSTGASL